MFAASRERRIEGIVAKRLDSRFRPGARACEWRKVKNFRTQRVIIAGWRGKGRRDGRSGPRRNHNLSDGKQPAGCRPLRDQLTRR